MGGEAGREDGRVVSLCNVQDQKSTTRFSPAEEVVDGSTALKGLVAEAEAATKVSLADKEESEGKQQGDQAAAELSCCKLEGTELLCVPAA